MRTSEADILIIPGWSNSGQDHWQSRWQRNLKTARRVEQADWLKPDRDAWVSRLVEEVAACTRPAVLVAHSLGVATVLHAAPELDAANVAGAFLVSPSDLDAIESWPRNGANDWQQISAAFAPMPPTACLSPVA